MLQEGKLPFFFSLKIEYGNFHSVQYCRCVVCINFVNNENTIVVSEFRYDACSIVLIA